jgi:ribosomal protein S18 acetylase RimI-like enzyme
VSLPNVPAIPGLRIAHFDREADFGPVAAMWSETNLGDGAELVFDGAELRHRWDHAPGFDPADDVLVARVGDDVVALVSHQWRQRGRRVFHEVQPMVSQTYRRRGLGRALLAWAERHAAAGHAAGSMGPSDLPHVVFCWGDVDVDGVARFATRNGFAPDGYGILMARSLTDPLPDAPLPDGIELRPVRPEHHRRIWDADTEAFQDDHDPIARTDDDFERWFAAPDLDTSTWLVAWDGDEVAGSAWNVVYRAENARLGHPRGYIEHLSVRRPWRRRGLASALLVRSMQTFRDLGLEEARLGADAENLSGAVRLYGSLGFRRIRTRARYVKAL